MRFITHLVVGLTLVATAGAQQRWWLDQPVRLIQTNLREIDAKDFDVDVYVAKATEYGANTVLINVGGIVANYPTELEFHYRNPSLKFDLIGEVVKRLHEEGIRVIGRFDFSKINEKFAARHPEWLYRTPGGDVVNYNGQVHTCVNGGYQQEYLFKILGEAIDKYPLDGIFFNMIGYQTRDYSRNYYGICHSDACGRRFKEWSGGLALPAREDPRDPVFRKYDAFRTETKNDLFRRVNAFIKKKRPDIAICTYTDAGVDLIRSESGSRLSDNRPAWNYHSTDNVKRALGSFRDKQIANTAVSFVDIPYRHANVAPALTRMRLIEDMLNGGSLDFYMIGRLDNQEDRAPLAAVKDIFRFHQAHESWFTNVRSNSGTLLVRGAGRAASEFRGLLRILAENHLVFDAMEAWRLAAGDLPKQLRDYKLIVLADTANLSDEACRRLDNYVAGGGLILATGYTSTSDELGNPQHRFRLKAAGVEPKYKVHPKARGAYLRVFPGDKKILRSPSFDNLDLIYLWGDFLEYRLTASAKGYLGLIPPAMYGPPEKCYYTEVTRIPGLIVNHYGKGTFAYLPWPVGAQYEYKSHHGHRMIVQAAIRDALGFRQDVEVRTTPLVEVTREESREGAFEWIGLANHTGELGTAFYPPLPIRDIEVRLKPAGKVRRAHLLRAGRPVTPRPAAGGWISVRVPELRDFEMIVLEYR